MFCKGYYNNNNNNNNNNNTKFYSPFSLQYFHFKQILRCFLRKLSMIFIMKDEFHMFCLFMF